MPKTKHLIKALALTALAALTLAGSISAGTYLSPKGKFVVTYPDNWVQVEYVTVDLYLLKHDAGETVMDYDAVFSDGTDPFFAGAYMIMTVDTTPMTGWQIDSTLDAMKQSYGRDISYFPVADLNAHQETDKPSYDRDAKVITVMSDIKENGELIKKHAYMMKFYKNGIANFYCFAPDSLFDASLPVFQNIMNSLNTENIKDVLPKEDVKIADLKDREIPKGDEENSESRSRYPFYGTGALAIILVIIMAARRKRRAAQGKK